MTRRIESQAKWLADKLSGYDGRLRGLESKSDLAFSSIEDGSIVEKDLDGNLVSSVGKQHDGSHVQVPYVGPVPAAPVAPVLSAVPGVVQVRWNGKFVGDAVSAMDFKHVAVHVGSTSVVETTPSTQVATIRGELGDVATVTAPEGILYVALVAWSAAGKASARSAVTAVHVPAPADAMALNGKITVADHAPTLADGDGKPDDALWNQIDPETGGQVAVWRWTGAEWVDFPITETMLPLVNIAEGTYGRLQGVQLEADAINGMVITGAVIQSPGEGAGYQLTEDGYTSKDADGNVTVRLPADGSPAQFRGDIEARSLTATGKVSLQSPESTIESGASLILESGVSAPISPPSVATFYPSVNLPRTGVLDGLNTAGLVRANNLWWRTSKLENTLLLHGIDNAGTIVRTITTGLTGSNGVTAIGNELFVLGKWLGASEARHVAVYNATTGDYIRRWVYPAYGPGTYQPALGTDGTNILIAQTPGAIAGTNLTWRIYNKTSGAFISAVQADYDTPTGFTGIHKGPADFGTETVAVTKSNGTTELFTPAGALIGAGGWYSAYGRPSQGLAWADGYFWALQGDALIRYSTIKAPSGAGVGDTSDWWIAHSWSGPDNTQTPAGPAVGFKFMRRSELQLSTSTPPPGVTGVSFYLAKKATTPARADLHLVTASAGGTSAPVPTLPSNWATFPNPSATNTFPNSTPGRIKSRIGAFEVKGDGSGKWGPLTFNTDGTMTTNVMPKIAAGNFSGTAVAANGGVLDTIVTFPPGKFTTPPAVTATAANGRITVAAYNITATSATIRASNWTNTATPAFTMSWIATEAG